MSYASVRLADSGIEDGGGLVEDEQLRIAHVGAWVGSLPLPAAIYLWFHGTARNAAAPLHGR